MGIFLGTCWVTVEAALPDWGMTVKKFFKNFYFFVDMLYKCTILYLYKCKIHL